jgi:methylisocitrate lyase
MAGERLRKQLEADRLLVMAGVYDPLSALIAEDVGFRGLSLGGYATASVHGTAEPLLSLAELRE